MALLSICNNPRGFYGHNLVDMLQSQLSTSEFHKNNTFEYALSVLGLCKATAVVDTTQIQALSTAALSNSSNRIGESIRVTKYDKLVKSIN